MKRARDVPGARGPKHEWRCSRCGKLLAVVRGDRLHIQFARGHEYFVGFPAATRCRSCKTLNELRDEKTLTGAANVAAR